MAGQIEAVMTWPGWQLFSALMDTLPMYTFLLDDDMRVLQRNKQAADLTEDDKDSGLRRFGDVLHCLQSLDSPQGCGHGPQCARCLVRASTKGCLITGAPHHEKIRSVQNRGGKSFETVFFVQTTPMSIADQKLVFLAALDVAMIKELIEIVGICSYCGRVRTPEGTWESLHNYAKNHLGVSYSHGICDTCMERELAKPPGLRRPPE